jgi:cytochrome c
MARNNRLNNRFLPFIGRCRLPALVLVAMLPATLMVGCVDAATEGEGERAGSSPLFGSSAADGAGAAQGGDSTFDGDNLGDATAGRELFRRQCAACHGIEPGEHKTGPSLAGIVGRPAGSTDFPRYRGFVGANFVWTPNRLDRYLADPLAFIVANTLNGTTSMTFRVPQAKQRRNIIAYLETVSRGEPAPVKDGTQP